MSTSAQIEQSTAPPIPEVRDGRLYIDGIHVWKDQLSLVELKRYFPEDYAKMYGVKEEPCPICQKAVSTADPRIISGHILRSHKEWRDKHKKKVSGMSGTELFETIREILA